MKDKKMSVFLKATSVFFLISLLFLFFFDVSFAIILFLIFSLIQAYIIWKDKIGQEFIVALFVSLFITSYFNYEYIGTNFIVGKINLFPLVAWTAGLVFLREIYERYPVKKFKFIKICLIYWVVLLVLEFIGYNYLGIRLNSSHSGLFNLSLMHSPVFLKAFYFLAGPIYLFITNYLKVK